MKTKLSKKGLLSIVLTLLMFVALVPMSTLAATVDGEGKVTSTEFELFNYGYGKPVHQCDASGELGIVYIDHYKNGIYTCKEESYSNPDDLEPTTDWYFAANKQYYFVLNFSAHWESEGFADSFTAKNTTLTVDGVPCEQVGAAVKDKGEYIAVFKLPILKAVPVAIPFTKFVEQGGSIAPGAEEFELEVQNFCERSNNPIANYLMDGLSFTTSGNETVEKQFTISNDSFDAILNLLNEGILVSEKQGWSTGWQYDDAVWYVVLHHDPVVNTLDKETVTMPGYSFDFYKGKMVDGEFVPDSQTPTNKMTFTNTYTENTVTVKIPFVKKVTLGGNVAPTSETFEFEIFDVGNGSGEYADVYYNAEVTVNGKGEFAGEIVITGPESQIEELICEGFFVREVKGSVANWTYSDAVWCVIPEWNNQQEREFVAYPTVKETSDNGDYYVVANEPAKEMSFENIYTENKTVEPVKPVDKTPQTGDHSAMGLWGALLFVSSIGVAATIVIGKKKYIR